MIVVANAEVVRKEARTAEERARLARECQILTFARHPGVVELVAAEPNALTLGRVEGSVLAGGTIRSEREIAALGAAIATILADLHDIGVVHGRVEASHVLLDGGGRPVLCGLGHGICPALPAGPHAPDDVAALAAMLDAMVDPAIAGRLPKALAQAAHPRPASRPTARRLARTLVDLAAEGTSERCMDPRHGKVVAVAVAVVILGLTVAAGRVRGTSPQLRPVLLSGHIVVTASGRYRVGASWDQIVLGRWRCRAGADPLPAVLRTSTGEVWAFDGWATRARALDARPLATVPGATGLRVAAAARGCDRLVVVRRSGPPVTLIP